MGDLTSAADILDIDKCRQQLERAREWMVALLGRIGEPGTCAGCGAELYWVRHQNGRIAPYEATGAIHFATCPRASDFRKRYSK
jgi:hypothetical protein